MKAWEFGQKFQLFVTSLMDIEILHKKNPKQRFVFPDFVFPHDLQAKMCVHKFARHG
jgi:hypothetical protein